MTSATPHEFKFERAGYCNVCEQAVVFAANHPYFRNSLRCPRCDTLPRQRAIWHYLNAFAPNWRGRSLHESSPGWDKVSQRLAKECPKYISSQYDPSVPFGTIVNSSRMLTGKYRSENLEAQTFDDECFDVVLTQDVFEHIFYPDRAIKEIARTLRPGGLTIMTVPIVMGRQQSRRRSSLLNDGHIKHLLEPQYHGNPIGGKGALVTVDWGYDIASYLQSHSGLSFVVFQFDDIDLGIRAELNEVLVGFKGRVANI